MFCRSKDINNMPLSELVKVWIGINRYIIVKKVHYLITYGDGACFRLKYPPII